MTVQLLLPAKKVVWKCSEKEGEWKDTLITFDLEQIDDQVFINFSHTNWAQQSSLCSHCSTKWAVFMLSLKGYLEKGKGQAFPDDVHVNHNDFRPNPLLLARPFFILYRGTDAADNT